MKIWDILREVLEAENFWSNSHLEFENLESAIKLTKAYISDTNACDNVATQLCDEYTYESLIPMVASKLSTHQLSSNERSDEIMCDLLIVLEDFFAVRKKSHETMVHAKHCCSEHGCKYGDEDCPVVLGTVEQIYMCDECVYEENENEDNEDDEDY